MDGSDMKSTTLRSRQLVATIPSSSGLTFDGCIRKIIDPQIGWFSDVFVQTLCKY